LLGRVAVPPATNAPVAITLKTGVWEVVASINEKLSVPVVALAPAVRISTGASTAMVVVTARMSLRMCVAFFLAGLVPAVGFWSLKALVDRACCRRPP
jgi:hypothetical protein